METQKAKVDIKRSGNIVYIYCSGEWTVSSISQALVQLKKISRSTKSDNIQWDVSKITDFDSAGMIGFIKYFDKFNKQGCKSTIIGQTPDQEEMYQLIRENITDSPATPPKKYNIFEKIGKNILDFFKDIIAFFSFLGEASMAFLYYIKHPSSIRYKAIIKYIESSAIRALGIIALTAFLIGIVIAYQSAVQLEKFGANIFIVDMIGISITRELAPLITAIVVAGRSGSAYTAQIGVMKLTEELDAMKTMGFDPFRFLVLPRMIALMIAMPLLIFFADIMGIFGGMLVAKMQLNISYSEFINHLHGALEPKHYWVGIIKGPFFAWLIAAVGCFRGFQVSRDTESIGYYTTVSVVNAIFLVIACDAIFSVILTELEI